MMEPQAHMPQNLSVDARALSAFCRRHYIARLALFGSVLRDDFRPDSDIDVLVEFLPGHVPGPPRSSSRRAFGTVC
jgi:predicted nucleotidyltransferase